MDIPSLVCLFDAILKCNCFKENKLNFMLKKKCLLLNNLFDFHLGNQSTIYLKVKQILIGGFSHYVSIYQR